MKVFESETAIVIRSNGYTASFLVFPYMNGSHAEIVVSVYRDGHKSEADKCVVHGGKMSKNACSSNMQLFMQICKIGISKFSQYTLTFNPSDERRARIYDKALKPARISFERVDTFFTLKG